MDFTTIFRSVLGVAVIATCNLAYAKILHVDTDTGVDSYTYEENGPTTPWKTIGRAVWGSIDRGTQNQTEAAQPGDTVRIHSGEYSSTLTGGDRWNVLFNPANSGASDAPIQLEADGVVTILAPQWGGPAIGASDRDYIVWLGPFYLDEANIQATHDTGTVVLHAGVGNGVAGLRIDGNGDPMWNTNHTGVRVEACNGCFVRDCIIHDVYTSGVTGANGVGVQVYESDDLLVENNEIYDSGSGIFVKGPSTIRSMRPVIRFNLVYRADSAGIIVSGSEQGQVYQNVIRNSGDGIRLWQLSEIARPLDNYIVNNTVHNVTGSGINLRYDAASGNIARNNLINGAPYIYFSESRSNPDGITSDTSLYSDFASRFFLLTSVDGDFVSWQTTFGRDAASLTADPLFVDEPEGDLRPCRGPGIPAAGCSGVSPAIDLGVDLLDLDHDTDMTDSVTVGAYLTGDEIIGPGAATDPAPTPPSGLVVH